MYWKILALAVGLLILLDHVSSKRTGKGPESRIFNGVAAKKGQFPYAGFLTYIRIRRLTRARSMACAGTIIHKNWGLTANHCVDLNGTEPAFTVGGILVDQSDGVTYPIRKFYQHEWFVYNTKHNEREDKYVILDNYDVALMRFRDSIKFNQNTKPIQIMWDHLTDFSGEECTFVGWGITSPKERGSPRLMYHSTTVLTNDNCRQMSNKEWDVTQQLHICTSTAYSEKTACSGDSGGPLVSNGRLIGLHIFGECGGVKPSVFAHVPAVFDWIRKHTGWCGDDLIENYGDSMPPLIYYAADEDRCEHPEKYTAIF